MSRQILILVEGQTEERFVKDVLAPQFYQCGPIVPTLLVTKRVKDGPNFKGGVTSYTRFKNDVTRLLRTPPDWLITTMLDYYRLPSDFPGMQTRPTPGTFQSRVVHVETCIEMDLGQPPSRFVAFLALNEFEALLLSSPLELPKVMTEPAKQAQFTSLCASAASPEEINDRPGYSPSNRIEQLFPAYRKPLHGPTTASRIGLPAIRAKCPHFDTWVRRLEAYCGR